MKFEINYKYDYEVYKRFCDAVYENVNGIKRYTYGIMAVLILSGAILYNIYGLLVCLIYVGLGLLFPFVFKKTLNKRIKKTWDSNTMLQNMDVKVTFYEDKLVQEAVVGTTNLEYAKLYKIFETDTDIYFMMGKNQGLGISKELFKEDELKFVQSLIK